MPTRLDTRDKGFEKDFQRLLTSKREGSEDVSADAASIIAEIRGRGDAALVELTKRFDGVDAGSVSGLKVEPEAMRAAHDRTDAGLCEALVAAAGRIRSFHERQVPEDIGYTDETGVALGLRHGPLDAAGIYVPGGKAAYPSTVLMNAIPAGVAGVGRLAMAVPATDGVVPDPVLAAAHIAGVGEIWTIGGAQAIAALAFGTETIEPVDKIVGPGNAYVAAAKRLVFGQVGIDSIAGPSEILVLADKTANPEWIALDLLSQTEHDEAAQSILVTDDPDMAEAVAGAVEQLLPGLDRSEIAAASWDAHGAIIIVRDLDEGAELANRIAPEHIEISTGDPEAVASRIRHAGAIFLGQWTPEAVGDYVGGPNHVLPTARTARFSSGLGVLDFMKRTTTLSCDADSLKAIGLHAETLAKAEGLEAHGLSISRRLNR